MSRQQRRESANTTQNPEPDCGPTDASDLLTVQEFAALARVTQRTVRDWAARRVGPEPIHPAGARIVRYDRAQCEAWLSGRDVREIEPVS